MRKITILLLTGLLAFGTESCSFLFGSKKDATVDDIFTQGSIDPNLNPDNIGYVPILPFWSGFSNPVDVYVGYDEMVYVIDDNGLNILDQSGQLFNTIPIQGATDVIQDRRLHTYVSGRVDKMVNGQAYNLAAVYHLSNTASGGQVVFEDTLIQPFADASRNNTSFRESDDEQVEFSGLATLADNTLYVSRRGPRNDLASIARPDNTILFFNEDGVNTGYANGLNPVSSSLKSTLNISAIATFASPPQSLNGISNSADFLICQTKPEAQYKVLWIRQLVDPDVGTEYIENAELVQQDTSKATRFLYEPNRFQDPEDVYIAPDFSGYIFVVDRQLDSLYQFTRKGYEGVNAPPNSRFTKQLIASFGGYGSGPFNFKEPSGVCYNRKIVYVADKGNGRIARFKLSTDLE